MGGEANEVMVIDRSGVERWTRATKAQVAMRLAQRIAQTLNAASRDSQIPSAESPTA
jgi:phosphopantothenoylcysteine decarboxylase/phosphopantothenate--cysteine ligase